MAKIASQTESKKSVKGSSETKQPSLGGREAEIAALAYQFYVERGFQDGFDQEDWLRAEQAVRSKKA